MIAPLPPKYGQIHLGKASGTVQRTERYGNGRPECVDLNLGASATAKLVTPVCSLLYGKRTAPAVLRAEIAGNLTV